MKKFKVITNNNWPTRFPHWNTALCYLLLDYYNAPEWLWTVAIIFFGFGWIMLIARYFTQEKVDIFATKEETKQTNSTSKSKWQMKLEEIQNKQK